MICEHALLLTADRGPNHPDTVGDHHRDMLNIEAGGVGDVAVVKFANAFHRHAGGLKGMTPARSGPGIGHGVVP